MREFVRNMVRLRLEDLPLLNAQNEPIQLPDDAIEFILSVVEWAIEKEKEPAPE